MFCQAPFRASTNRTLGGTFLALSHPRERLFPFLRRQLPVLVCQKYPPEEPCYSTIPAGTPSLISPYPVRDLDANRLARLLVRLRYDVHYPSLVISETVFPSYSARAARRSPMSFGALTESGYMCPFDSSKSPGRWLTGSEPESPR